MDHPDRQEGSATHEHDHEGEAEHSQDDIESELVNPTSQRRVRTQTEKGKGFAREAAEKKMNAVSKRMKTKSDEINQLMTDGAESNEVHRAYSGWMTLFEEFLCQHEVYSWSLDPDVLNKYNEHVENMKTFKSGVENWFNSKATNDLMDKANTRRAGNGSQMGTGSNVGSCAPSRRSELSSARLKEDQKRAELQTKAAALKKRKTLELAKLNLKLQEEELALDTELAVAEAKTRVLDQYEHGLSGGSSHGNRNDSLHEINNISTADQIQHSVELNPNSEPFTPRHHTVLSNEPDYTVQNECSGTKHTKGSEMLEDSQAIRSVVRQLRKHPPEIHKFSGDPLQYRKFVRQFQVQIVANSDTCDELMNHLEQLTYGEANRIVSGYSYLDAEQGYRAAMKELEERYGNPEMIANAFIKKAVNWQNLKPDDAKALDEYALFLAECENAVRSIAAMKVLEYSENLTLLVGKLPFYLHDRWRSIVQQIKSRGQAVEFSDLVQFVKGEAKKANDPIYGRDAMKVDTSTQNRNSTYKGKSNHAKGTFFASNSSSENETPSGDQKMQPDGNHSNKTRHSAFTTPCLFCKNEHHALDKCETMIKKPFKETISFLKSNGLCFGCLKYGHQRSACRSKATCSTCKRQHPTICHSPFPTNVTDGGKENTSKGPTDTSIRVNSSMGAGNSDECTMAIVPVIVTLKDGVKTVATHAFLDPGSSVTYCTEELMYQLGASGTKINITLNTMGTPFVMDTYAVKGLTVGNPISGEMIDLPKTYTKDKMPVTLNHMPTREDINQWPHLQDVTIPEVKAGVGLLIGNNVPDAYAPIVVKTGPRGSPHATKSRLGWILWNVMRNEGKVSVSGDHGRFAVNRAEVVAVKEVEELKKLDQMVRHSMNFDFPERISDEREPSQEDKQFLAKVDRSMSLENGHYKMELPFKDDTTQLPNNRVQAMQRLNSLQKRLKRDTNLHKDYSAFMSTLIDKGYAEQVPDDELDRDDGKVWYIPHHSVYHPKKPDKIRIVFDCAATYAGISLNSQLLQGPDLTNNLIGVLLRFRKGKIAVMGDIEAMFHQVSVTDKDTDCLRFLWWKDGNLHENPTTYRMLVHLFGATSSPSCANAALRQTALDNTDEFDQTICDVVNKNFYVDDCLSSVDTEDEAVALIQDVSSLCAKGGFHLAKWNSNSADVLQTIPVAERAKDVRNINLGRNELPMECALGVQWLMDSDTLGFQIVPRDYPATRRGILSAVSAVYDPLGFASPFVLSAKILLQELCSKGAEWDESISDADERKWKRWLGDLPKLENIKLQRCYRPNEFTTVKSCQLHYFSDASDSGYGVACYIRLVDDKARISSSLLMAKSRVSPLKKVTIPRMELTAATLSVRLNQVILRELDYKIDETFYWTDSMSLLHYIANETSRFQTFVANRLTVIHDSSSVNQWHYIDTKVNPADAASRGQTMDKFIENKNWLIGPDFLRLPREEWPMQNIDSRDVCHTTEIKATVAESTESPTVMDRLLTKFSSWKKLKRIVAWILKARKNLLC